MMRSAVFAALLARAASGATLTSAIPPPSLARSVSQEEMYSYVTVADAPEGFSGLGTTVVDDV